MQIQDQRRRIPNEADFFTGYGDANRYKIIEIIGKGSYGVVCAATDTHTGEKVAIKKITDIFEHMSDAIRILREIKLLRLLRHPDIVEIKRIMMPPSRRDFKDIYVVFELMESDLHQVIKVNDDLTPDHHRFFLYQMLRALKYMHTANVYHRDLKPKNILANANCKLKICDFGLARVAFSDTPTTTFWTDYVATRWYRAPELCGSFFSKYTPAIDIWSIGCIFAEVLTGKPLFPGKSVVHQLDLITDLLGTPPAETINGVRNEKARKYLKEMRKKCSVSFAEKFPKVDPLALKLLQRLLAFDPKDRPSAEEALADPYFKGLAKIEREPCCQPISKLEFEFERRKVTKEDIRELIFREILEYHPQLLKDYMAGHGGPNYLYPSAIGHFNRQFAYLQEHTAISGPVIPPERTHSSLPRSTVNSSIIPPKTQMNRSAVDNGQIIGYRYTDAMSSSYVSKVPHPPPKVPNAKPVKVVGPVLPYENIRYASNSHDGRVYVQNSANIHPHQAMISQQQHCYLSASSAKNQENHTTDAEREISSSKKQQNYSTPVVVSTNGSMVGNKHVDHHHVRAQPQHYTVNSSPGMSTVEVYSNPYYQTLPKTAVMMNGQIAIDAKLLQAQSHAVARREASAIQIGLT